MGVTIKEALKNASKLLIKVSDTPNLDSEMMLSHLLNKDRVYLIVNSLEYLENHIYNKYTQMIEERMTHKPVQYIIGKQEFMGLDFEIEEGVLIPRPDTEILVEKAIEIIDSRDIRFLDMCCGSGAIGISIAKHTGSSFGIMVDISDVAIKVTSQNIKKQGLASKLNVIKSDLFNDIKSEIFDIIVSNPPYIPTDDILELKNNVKEHEPMLALDGGADGLVFYNEIIKKAFEHMVIGGIILLEIGYNQADEVIEIMKSIGKYGDYEIYKDLAGHDRVVKACRIG